MLVVRGEPGIGKTALLDYAAGRAAGFRVVRAWGVESEMELAFAGLHQLCVPMLGRLDQLPGPQRDALAVVFGMREGPAPDRFLVGLATSRWPAWSMTRSGSTGPRCSAWRSRPAGCWPTRLP